MIIQKTSLNIPYKLNQNTAPKSAIYINSPNFQGAKSFTKAKSKQILALCDAEAMLEPVKQKAQQKYEETNQKLKHYDDLYNILLRHSEIAKDNSRTFLYNGKIIRIIRLSASGNAMTVFGFKDGKLQLDASVAIAEGKILWVREFSNLFDGKAEDYYGSYSDAKGTNYSRVEHIKDKTRRSSIEQYSSYDFNPQGNLIIYQNRYEETFSKRAQQLSSSRFICEPSGKVKDFERFVSKGGSDKLYTSKYSDGKPKQITYEQDGTKYRYNSATKTFQSIPYYA